MNGFATAWSDLLPGTWYLMARIDQTIRGTPPDLSGRPIFVLLAFAVALAAICAWRLSAARRDHDRDKRERVSGRPAPGGAAP
jgi:ABC-2 type transport system permease protein